MNETLKTTLITGLTVTIAITGAYYFDQGDTIELTDPQKIIWQKPTTDSEWAEDVKVESFDVRSTEILETMVIDHTDKLERILNDDKIEVCPDCVRYEIKEELQRIYGLQGRELTDEVDKQFQEQIDNRLFDIEKITQSIERMNKELELRKDGAVKRDNIIDKK